MSTGTRANLVRFANEARFTYSPLRGKYVKSEFVTILT